MKRGLTLALVLSLALPLSFARAGDRPLEIGLVDASPNGTEGSSACMDAIASRIRQDDVHLHRPTRGRFLSQVGAPADADAMHLEAAAFAHATERVDEAIAIVDCRPTDRTIDVLVRAPSGGLAHMRLRGVAIDTARETWIGDVILVHGWTGFVP